MTSLVRPWPAKSTILARITSRYGDVYLRDILANSAYSSLVKVMTKGLSLGMTSTSH